MPTAKKKIGSLALFTRHPDGTVSGPPGSPRTGVVGLPATPAPVPAGTTGHVPQLQPAADIIASRSEAAASARLPMPRTGRYSSANQQTPPSQMSPPSQHGQPMMRVRTTASDQGARAGLGGPWEDSTVDSMFDGVESRAGSERYRPQTLHGRQYSDITTRRARQLEHTVPRQEEPLQPFVINDNGLLKVISSPPRPEPATLNTSLSSGLLNERPPRQDDLYGDDRQHYETTPTKLATLRRTKLPHRDARDTVKRNSFTDRLAGYPPELSADPMGMSPERASENGDRLERLRQEEIARRKLEAKRERELQAKRSTMFENLEGVEEPTFNDTRAAVLPSSDMMSEVVKEELTPEGTPRRPRQPLARIDVLEEKEIQRQTRQQLSQKLAALNSLSQETALGRTSRQPLAAQNSLLQESALVRTASRRLKESSTKKRRHNPDYDDAELDSMSYSDLRAQTFDYDPQAAALQQTEVPTGGTIEEKLEHYRGKDSLLQHQFFTQISVAEWEASGDWFLDQFGGVMEKMKAARKEKRKVVGEFENEIATREEAVRGKIEGIEHTLLELKEEGQTMMEGKDVEDVEF